MSQETLTKLDKNITNNINNLKHEVLNLMNIMITLPEENQNLYIKCEKMENETIQLQTSRNSLS